MIKIGDFARLSQVSVVTLRHYDEMGLLKPVRVDRTSGYRYYDVDQLARLNRILALKDLGFSLDQIESVLNGLTVDQLRGMLKMKHAEVQQQLEMEEARLARIAARLRQIELEDSMPEYDVVLKTIPATLVASRRVTIPTNAQVPELLGSAIMETYQHVHENGAKPVGPHMALWHQPAAIVTDEIAEAAVPLDRTIPGSERVTVYEIPQTQVVAAVHNGGFEGFQRLHGVLLSWIEENGYRVVGPYREVYIKHDPNNLSDSSTEVQYPVEKAS